MFETRHRRARNEFSKSRFHPGPTNMPEELRKAIYMPTIDHRSPVFGNILHPALAGVKKVLKERDRRGFRVSVNRHRWLGNRPDQHAELPVTRCWRRATACSRIAGSTCASVTGWMCTIVETPWGQGLPADRYEEILTADKRTQDQGCSGNP